jgi:hypothetical protein
MQLDISGFKEMSINFSWTLELVSCQSPETYPFSSIEITKIKILCSESNSDLVSIIITYNYITW